MVKNIITCLFWTRFCSLEQNGQGWLRFPYRLEKCVRGKVLENEMLKRVSTMPNGCSIRNIGGQLYVANPRYTYIYPRAIPFTFVYLISIVYFLSRSFADFSISKLPQNIEDSCYTQLKSTPSNQAS
jgi:hypothetical protein